ncbi:MAG: HD domain-containing protein [Chloroflexi bacterium]|nr:HD domain-containing protein [Chloroflexota bacterium]
MITQKQSTRTPFNIMINYNSHPLLSKLKEFFNTNRIQAYLVGGFVRDNILNKKTNDIDIAVTGDALSIAMQFADNDDNKIARVVLGQYYVDLNTIVDNIDTDLARRDFTVDAMAINLDDIYSETKLIDPFHGLDDLKSKIIRTVSNNSFINDPLRLLRAIRLSAQLNFTIEKETEGLIREKAHLISTVSAERIREELCYTLAAPYAAESVRKLDELNILHILIPELTLTKGVEQPVEHYWDVFNHSIETISTVERILNAQETGDSLKDLIPWSMEIAAYFKEEPSSSHSRSTLLKIAALLHDIEKPSTKNIEAESGRTRFIGHDKEGSNTARKIMERLRFSNKEVKAVETMIKYHMRPTQLTSHFKVMPTNRAIYRYYRDTGDEGIAVLFLSLADHLAARGPTLDKTQWQDHTNLVKYVIIQNHNDRTIVMPLKLIDGNDLINMGLSPGSSVGSILETVREAQAAGEIGSRDKALELAQKLIND